MFERLVEKGFPANTILQGKILVENSSKIVQKIFYIYVWKIYNFNVIYITTII